MDHRFALSVLVILWVGITLAVYFPNEEKHEILDHHETVKAPIKDAQPSGTVIVHGTGAVQTQPDLGSATTNTSASSLHTDVKDDTTTTPAVGIQIGAVVESTDIAFGFTHHYDTNTGLEDKLVYGQYIYAKMHFGNSNKDPALRIFAMYGRIPTTDLAVLNSKIGFVGNPVSLRLSVSEVTPAGKIISTTTTKEEMPLLPYPVIIESDTGAKFKINTLGMKSGNFCVVTAGFSKDRAKITKTDRIHITFAV